MDAEYLLEHMKDIPPPRFRSQTTIERIAGAVPPWISQGAKGACDVINPQRFPFQSTIDYNRQIFSTVVRSATRTVSWSALPPRLLKWMACFFTNVIEVRCLSFVAPAQKGMLHRVLRKGDMLTPNPAGNV